ncbi:MAG: hypothetical protein CVV58_01165 [Tenericutes bacterium HGW-Tenericutes-3]|nr:MAG: hypothetical protein CVV58_01165 [Tenericutes bacterium HGW-Tenericutes-3]
MSFLLSFFSFFTIFSVRVEWINHILDIPLYNNIEEYKFMPKANLYINENKVIDPLVYYERDGVDHTFFSVVTTSDVQTFTIRYRVHFPTYDVVHTQDIIFNIVDISPPVIIKVPSFRVALDSNMPDLLNGLIVTDNYDDLDDLSIDVNSYEVLLDQTGIYVIYYQVSDQSGNIAYATTLLEVYDYQAPTITLKKEIVLPFGTIFNWRDFVTVKDNDDPFPYVFIDETQVDYSHLGVYMITIYATDKNGLVAQENVNLSIIDDQAPVITLKSQPLPISVFSRAFDIDFLSYILSVSDNYDLLTIEDVTFTHDIEFDMCGTYYIYYALTDHSGNIGYANLKISVIDDEKPQISIIAPLVFDVFETEPFFIDFILYSDNYTPYDMLVFKMTESVNMDKVGLYPLIIEVTDKSSNKAILRTYIEIVDRVSPEITQLNDMLITDFLYKDMRYYFEASDNYNQAKDIDIEIDDSLVDYEKIGSYKVMIYASDLSGNIGFLESEIYIVDIIDPILVLSQNAITIDVFDAPLNLESYIVQASDNYDDLSYQDVDIEGQIDYQNIGKYTITFLLTDASKNITNKALIVTVDDRIPPSISTVHMTVYVGQYFDPLLGLTISDNLGDAEITWFPQIIDTSTPGVKTISYIAYDARGNYTTFDREITVEPVEETFDIISYLPVIILTVLGLSAGFYFYKQMR